MLLQLFFFVYFDSNWKLYLWQHCQKSITKTHENRMRQFLVSCFYITNRLLGSVFKSFHLLDWIKFWSSLDIFKLFWFTNKLHVLQTNNVFVTCNLFVTSKIKFSNSPILQFSNLKYCIKAKEPFKTPLKWCISSYLLL